MTQNHLPIRMCAVCKIRFNQRDLRRYRIINSSVYYGKGEGRGFYICQDCLAKDEKILKKSLKKVAGNFIASLKNGQNLKEILLNGEYSDFRDSK